MNGKDDCEILMGELLISSLQLRRAHKLKEEQHPQANASASPDLKPLIEKNKEMELK